MWFSCVTCDKRACPRPPLYLKEMNDDGGLKFGNRDCDVGLWGDGTARNIHSQLGSIRENGITIGFVDTAYGEESFEVLRATLEDGVVVSPAEAVVQITNDLRGCARRFKSISFVDTKGANFPGHTFEYTVITKFNKVCVSMCVCLCGEGGSGAGVGKLESTTHTHTHTHTTHQLSFIFFFLFF